MKKLAIAIVVAMTLMLSHGVLYASSECNNEVWDACKPLKKTKEKLDTSCNDLHNKTSKVAKDCESQNCAETWAIESASRSFFKCKDNLPYFSCWSSYNSCEANAKSATRFQRKLNTAIEHYNAGIKDMNHFINANK